MSRRRIVLFVGLGLVLAIFAAVGAGVFVLTNTGWGQDKARKLVQGQFAAAVHGRVYVGRVSGTYLNGLTFDSLEIRDAEDSLFVASGPITVSYDARDLMDKRLLFSRVDLQHPTVYLRQHENWDWNFWQIFRHGRTGPKATGPQFGDYVVLDSVTVHDATFELTQPWHPDDSLHGARRDSAINAALHNKDLEIRRRREGYARTRRWTAINGVLGHVRVNDPDSVGRLFVIDHLDAHEADPPFVFHDVAGRVRNLGDSVWLDISHFDLPGSVGSAAGKVVWGSDLPVRYDVHVIGDSVSMADVAWIYPTLPTTGGGSVVLDVRNERDLNVMDYKLTKLDVRSTGSRLRGAITFAVGGPVLQIKDVNVQAEPLDFALIRTFNGKPLPVDWQGQIRGTVVARGGPLTQFVVDSSHLVFHDAHVPGAVSELSARGGLDILQPAFTVFHHLDVNAQSVDLRTIQFLYPNFPRLRGTISGTATLDSSWLDVRFANADLRFHDADAPVSRLLGSGRVTYGDPYMTYDASLFADSLSLTALRRAYPKLPVIGAYAGTIRTQGTLNDLFLDASLHGPGGAFTFNGHLDADPPSIGAHGSGRVVAVDPSLVLPADSVPAGSITGNYEVALTGDSLGDLDGSASLSLERSEFDGVHLFASRTKLRFGGGRLHVDTLFVETSAARLASYGGALGLHAGIVDSLAYEIHVDSLGGLRPFLATRAAAQTGKPDSLAGIFDLDSGMVTGNLDVLGVRGRGRGTGIYVNKDRGASATLRFDFADVLQAPRGLATLTLDTLVVSGVRVDTIGFSANLERVTARPGGGLQFAGTYGVGVLSDNGPTFALGGTVSHAAGTTAIGLDSGVVDLGVDRWRLARRGMINVDPTLITVDTLRAVNDRGGALTLAGRIPVSDSVQARFRADSIPVRDVATLLQIADTMTGWSTLHVDASGTRDAPRITLDAGAHDLQYGSMMLQRVAAMATYVDRRTNARISVYRDGIPTLEAQATLPMELQLFGARLLDDSLYGVIHADSADFAIVEAFVPAVTNAKGRLLVADTVRGTWDHPTVGGVIQMRGAQLTLPDIGITLRGLNADLQAFSANDSLAIRRLSASSGPSAADLVSVQGFIAFADRANPLFNLHMNAHEFRAVDKRTLARLDVSTVGDAGISLIGRKSGSTLTGSVNIVRGTIYLPEHDLAKKQMEQLSAKDLAGIIDTTDLNPRIKLPSPPSALLKDMTISGVRVTLGDEVWLRSSEVNIKLVGSLNVRRSGQRASDAGAPFAANGEAPVADSLIYRLALDGTLTAERGTYTLSLGPIQREFQVQSGTITFYGTPDLNPKINITAQYVVRQTSRPASPCRPRCPATCTRARRSTCRAERPIRFRSRTW